MGDHVGKDRTYDIGLAVDDHDVLTPHEVREVRIGDLVGLIAVRWQAIALQRDGHC